MKFDARILIAFLTLGVGACASTATYDPPRPMRITGYECVLERPLEKGALSANFRLTEEGELINSPSLQWSYRSEDRYFNPPTLGGRVTTTQPNFYAGWYNHDRAGFSLEAGFFSISRHIWVRSKEGKHGPSTLRLGLQVSLGARSFGRARFETDPRTSGGPFHMSVNWPELLALTKGADRLFFVAHDEERRLIDHLELDRDMILDVAEQAQATFPEIDAMVANYREMCTYFDEVEEQIILVT